MSSIAVMSRMRVNPNHFLPKSLIEAPMWYTFIVYEQKPVVCLVESLYLDKRILGVVAVNIKLELVADTLRVDSC